MIIAIDGPAAAGKGTLSRQIAETFGFHHLDTGLTYRETAKALLDRGLPLDDEAVAAAAATGAIVTVEEASVRGGLGGAVAEFTAAHQPVPVERVGFPGFLPTGSTDWLFKEFGLSAEGISAAAKRALQRKKG